MTKALFKQIVFISPPGKNCDRRISKFCYSQPCQNNGTCAENSTAYSCACQPGFTERNCADEINQCRTISCDNNATCARVSAGLYTCVCLDGYTGATCHFLQRVNFNRMSYLALPSVADNHTFSVGFKFITTVSDGLLLYQGKVNTNWLIIY